jgi:hypothetical protein
LDLLTQNKWILPKALKNNCFQHIF